MDWFNSTDSDLSTLEDPTLEIYTDGIPDSYELTQWYGSQDYPISTLTDAEMDDLVDGRAPLQPPFHFEFMEVVADPNSVAPPQTDIHGKLRITFVEVHA